jgi:membrane protein YqaA with SNARE-associated domain
LRIVLDRLPAPLFASLAVTSLIQDGEPASPETLCAAAGALAVTPTRSLLWVLVGGLAGYAVGVALFG